MHSFKNVFIGLQGLDNTILKKKINILAHAEFIMQPLCI